MQLYRGRYASRNQRKLFADINGPIVAIPWFVIDARY